MADHTRDPKPEGADKRESADKREQVLEVERKANEKQPENFKDDAVTDKVIELGPVDPDDSNIKDLDPPSGGTR